MEEDLNFVSALNQEFCAALDPLVDDEISPQDCFDPLRRILGKPVTPEKLASLDAKGQRALCAEFVEWFECDTINLEAIQDAIAAVLNRWPPQK